MKNKKKKLKGLRCSRLYNFLFIMSPKLQTIDHYYSNSTVIAKKKLLDPNEPFSNKIQKIKSTSRNEVLC